MLLWSGNVTIPDIETSIFIDIETSVYTDSIWMIGAMINDKIYQFTAPNYDSELDILKKFEDLLIQFPNYAIICYSKTYFDFRYIWSASTRHKLHSLKREMVGRPWIDFATLLGRKFKSPFGLGLKKLGDLFGYEFSHEGMDGYELSISYERQISKYGKITNYFKRVAEEYNIDDLRVMTHLISKFKKNIKYYSELEFMDITDYTKNLDHIASKITDSNITQSYYRISAKTEFIDELSIRINALGIPIPSIVYGKGISRMIWASEIGKTRIAELFFKLEL